MAWVTQEFKHGDFRVSLEESQVVIVVDDGSPIPPWIDLRPRKQAEAHAWAMMLRRAARRLEEIGKGID